MKTDFNTKLSCFLKRLLPLSVSRRVLEMLEDDRVSSDEIKTGDKAQVRWTAR